MVVSIPLEQGNVFRHPIKKNPCAKKQSQSLWNRAMSFDLLLPNALPQKTCLNPFGTGQCLSTSRVSLVSEPTLVSIPLEQGNVFRLKTEEREFLIGLRLNPFGTGQCLSTEDKFLTQWNTEGLNPFGTGQCLSTT